MLISPTINLPTKYGSFMMTSFGEKENFYLATNNTAHIPYIRIHSECVSWDCFWSRLCDCQEQLHQSLELIQKYGWFLFYLRQEWRWQWLHNKMRAIHIEQTEWKDTIQAYNLLWLDIDIRSYNEVIDILRHYWIKKIKLISNNPQKHKVISDHGIEIESITIMSTVNRHNNSYLYTKKEKLWHTLSLYDYQDNEKIYFYEPNDEYGRLANFSHHPITINNTAYQTVEHYYQSQKFVWTEQEKEIIDATTPIMAKKLSRKYQDQVISIRNDIKEFIMRQGNIAKYNQHQDLKSKLLETWNKVIIENALDDSYWWIGKDGLWMNRMWLMLMNLRTYFLN